MSLIYRRPWNRQPQSVARVDNGSTLLRGLIFSFGQAQFGVADISRRLSYGPTKKINRPGSGIKAGPSGVGYVINGSSDSITGDGAAVADALVEIAGGSSFTFQAVIDNVGAGAGSNPGFWRNSAGGYDATGSTFCISEGTGRRPWVRSNGVDILRPGSGPQWTNGQTLNIIFRVVSGSSVDVWFNGGQQHSASHSTATETMTGLAAIMFLGYQSDATQSISGNWTVSRFWNRALSDGEMASLQVNPWQLYAPLPRRIWAPAAGGGGAASLTAAEATHAHTADALVLTTSTALAISDASHAHGADNLTLSTSTALTIAEASHGHTADNLTLGVTGSATLVAQDATHGHAADNLGLTSTTGLTVADATHAHAADNLTLVALTGTSLVIEEAAHAHTADALALTTATSLAVAEALHGHAADEVALALGYGTLDVQDATHGHLADNVALSLPGQEDEEPLGGRRRGKRRPTMVGTPYTHDDYVQWVVRTVAVVAASGALDA